MTVQITFNLVDPALDSEELEAKTQNLQRQLREFDAVEQVDRVLDPHPPAGNKAFAGFLTGLLMVRMPPAQAPAVLSALEPVIGGSAIELTLEVDGRKITVKARNYEEFAAVMQTTQAFLASTAATSAPVLSSSPAIATSPDTAQPSPAPTAPVAVFFSYSHKDEALRDELAIHLTMLRRQGIIAAWHDREITAGSDWANAIDANLNAARVILLLVSANFLASDYCYDLELGRAMERQAAGDATVIPIILKPCDWTNAPFGKLQALPLAKGAGAKPITQWSDRDEAFLNVAQGIRGAIGGMRDERGEGRGVKINSK